MLLRYGYNKETYNLANGLHPYFRGAVLKKTGGFDTVLKNVISAHKSTKNLHDQARNERDFENSYLE